MKQSTESNPRLKNAAMTLLVTLGLLVGLTEDLRANNLLEAIDIRPVLESHGEGNVMGLAYVPDANVFYVAHNPMTTDNTETLGFIYKIDARGNLIGEIDLQQAYKPGSFFSSLTYDSTSGHLLLVIAVPKDDFYEERLIELDPSTNAVSRDIAFDADGGGGITIRGNDIWQARFSEDIIRHYTRDGIFIEDVSVAGSFPGFPGPNALSSSFTGGMYLVDFFNGRLVEIDDTGHELAGLSTMVLVGDRVAAIDRDAQNKHIFLATNGYIFVLGLDPKLVSINVKPHSRSNMINPKSGGLIAVALRTTNYFEATTVDSTKVHFGKTGVEASPVRTTMQDADGDGATDMLLYFNLQETGIACGDTTATLTGETVDGQKIIGSDLVSVRCDTIPRNPPLLGE